MMNPTHTAVNPSLYHPLHKLSRQTHGVRPSLGIQKKTKVIGDMSTINSISGMHDPESSPNIDSMLGLSPPREIKAGGVPAIGRCNQGRERKFS
jgi:hypothetical protein